MTNGFVKKSRKSEGTYGYDKVQVYKNVLKLKKLLGERQYDKREDKGY